MSDESLIVRSPHNRENPYVQINRKLLQSQNLSLDEKGLLGYLLSLPNDWKVQPTEVAKKVGIGRNKIYSLLTSLMDKGYCLRKDVKNGNLRSKYLYEILEEPVSKKDCRDPRFREHGNRELQKKQATDIRKRKQQQPKPVAAPPLVVVSPKIEAMIRAIPGMTDKRFQNLVQKYPEEKLWKAYGVLQHTKADNPIALYQKALKEDWDPNIPKNKETNRQWVEKSFTDGQIYNGAECFINKESIAFQRGMSNHKQLKFKENGFKDQFENILRHFGIKVNV